ncbi:AraC family transcriptional regulator [Paenibacillus arenilitoris]|uniref:Helix-turn-helix transcriptional regulator n=1 Tax=Paenibacillus arenilitoris TaxID=2772299 RepID=A0A927H6H7_9BACL|nr:AraC family transcriptional regulator [Paenibacillus arenilitoris]MBD2868579.1 helix-turn-helix transcriptional regulator [Paenibacillus arenilitoris]
MRRVVPASPAELLPLQLESIGIKPDQETMARPHGYPYYHWLQTLEGEGELSMNGRTWRMTERTGVLLAPGTPHRYEARGGRWRTGFITFHGSSAASIVQSFGWSVAERFQWEAGHDPITGQLESLLTFAESGGDPSGWRYSADLYRFLTLLRTDARTDNRPSISKRLERVQALLDWLEKEFANPGIGLAEMAAQLGIGERQLNERFRELFGQTAYAYLIQLRLRKAKELLPSLPDWTVRRIGEAVGFRDASHFVATFRQKEGMTPDAYRKLYGEGAASERPHN